jgi:hypothetical protein
MSPSAQKRRSAAATGKRTHVQVRFDRHIVAVLGDEHYPDADYLFTELAANAYDADATEVHFDYRFTDSGEEEGYRLTVSDNGAGMSQRDLEGYFTFGLPQKIERKTSPRFKRRLIGRYGLGKVSALKAAPRWFLETEHAGKRYFVDVDFARWTTGELEGFVIEEKPATGEPGTRIQLVDVRVHGFREDRIARAIRKLPLGRTFRVYLNDRLVQPRVWSGIRHYPIDTAVEIPANGKTRTERIQGGIWINDAPLPIDEGRRGDRPSRSIEKVIDSGVDELAGVEVKVNGATVTRELFGRETHAHGVNWIWGYVNADWLPVVANRTDYVRDSVEGQAFYKAMAEEFGRIYNPWRAEGELRRDLQSKAKGRRSRIRPPRGAPELDEGKLKRAERFLNEVGARIQASFDREPEYLPFFGPAPEPKPGRPSETRIKPLYEYRATETGLADENGAEVAPEFTLQRKRAEGGSVVVPKPRRGRPKRVMRIDGSARGGTRTVIRSISNVPLHLEFSLDGADDLAFRWGERPRGGMVLRINANHPLHRVAIQKVGGRAHRMYLAFLVALALAQRRWSVVDRQGIDDYVLELARDAVVDREA